MTDKNEPLPVPGRVALRLCADILFARADRLRGRTAASSGGRRGPEAARGAAAKDPARASQAAKLSHWATRLIRASRDDRASRLPGADAAVLGYLLAWLGEWREGIGQVWAELEGLGLPLPPPQKTTTPDETALAVIDPAGVLL